MNNVRNLLAALLLSIACAPMPALAQPSDAEKKLDEAARAAADGNSRKSVELATAAIKADAELASAYYLRGRENFRLGEIKRSVADFDKYVALRPRLESRQWERGIAYYYAGQFDKGAKQFELYQTFHDNDVENSVWRYLCMARSVGVEKAREVMLPIKNDRRVPMMQVFDLYRGKLKPEDVLAAAKAGEPDEDTLYARMFYADLYLGLYHEAGRNKELAAKHIRAAAARSRPNARINRYMWDVARIHAEQMKKKPRD